MNCYYCNIRLSPKTETDICDECLFHVDDYDEDYDEDIQKEIQQMVNRGVTPARFIE